MQTSSPVNADHSLAARLRGFGPEGTVAIAIILATNLVIAPLGAVLVLIWAYLTRTPWRDLGYARPKSWPQTLILGTLLGIVFKLVMKAVVMPLLDAPAINQTYRFVTGNTAALPALILTMVVVAGFGEETVFRGYLFERLRKLFGPGRASTIAILFLTSSLFAAVHYPDQRLPGAEQAFMTGLVFGTMFLATGRLWLPMVTHIVFDLTALAIIYWNLESEVAHFLFR